ncbi:hypothetical protein DFH09DRAFT_1316555 [Mycena vulgaris]|nr:hypothetical protein DFH09DRAFT_1316555 [Mycena vulgaris]
MLSSDAQHARAPLAWHLHPRRGFSLGYKVHSALAHALIPSTFRRRHPALRLSSAAPHPVQPSYIVSTIAYSAPPCSSLLHPMLAAPRPFLPLTRTIRFAPHAGYAPFDDHAIAVWTVTCTAPLVAIFTAQTCVHAPRRGDTSPPPRRHRNHPIAASPAQQRCRPHARNTHPASAPLQLPSPANLSFPRVLSSLRTPNLNVSASARCLSPRKHLPSPLLCVLPNSIPPSHPMRPDVLPRGHEIAAGVPESALESCTLPGPVELLGNNWREIDDVSLTIYHMNGSEERIESLAPVHRDLDGVNLRLEQYNVNIAFERGLSLFNHRSNIVQTDPSITV